MIKWISQLICGIVRQPHLVANPIANDDLFVSEVFYWECSLMEKYSAVNRASMGSSPIIPAWDSGQEARRLVANQQSPVQIWAIPLCHYSSIVERFPCKELAPGANPGGGFHSSVV